MILYSDYTKLLFIDGTASFKLFLINSNESSKNSLNKSMILAFIFLYFAMLSGIASKNFKFQQFFLKKCNF